MHDSKTQARILFLDNHPGIAHLCGQLARKDGQSYHEAVADAIALPTLVYGWRAGDQDIASGSVAYHPVFGEIVYGYHWYKASTMELMDNLKAAEANPAISAHIIHIDSHGGEAFGLHEAFGLIRSLKKPCFAVVESCAASAGYYLAAGCDKIYTTSKFSYVGSVGIMMVLVDESKYLEDLGIKVTELYSNYSPLKNADSRKLEEGETQEFIEKHLDPLAKAFIEDVKTARKKVAEDSDALKGEIYMAEEGQEIGLIDGVKSFDDALAALAKKAEPSETLTKPSRDINTIF